MSVSNWAAELLVPSGVSVCSGVLDRCIHVSSDKRDKEPRDLESALEDIARLRDVEAGLRSTNARLEAGVANSQTQASTALAQLRDTERNFKLLVQSVTDYAIYMLDPAGIVASWNAGAERIKGYRPHEIVGKHFSQFFTPEDRAAGIPENALKTAYEYGRFESEGWRLRRDGTRFWAFAVIDAVRDEEGRLLGFAKITRDMTERREAQERLQRAQEQLAQSQKMEAIGHLTGGIAHDFNNLLMIVSGQAQLMRMRAEDPKDIRALDAIEQASHSGANLTRQLLTFARRQRLNRVSVDVVDRLTGMRDLLMSSVGGAVNLVINAPIDLWPVETDVGELELALVNIAVNARDAMPNGGILRIEARNAAPDGDEVPLIGDFVALSLTDTGTGIAPDVMSKIFEPFFTTKEVGKGTGLGLSQVYGFARQNGGDVQVKSAPGNGTTVTIYLPRSQFQPMPANDTAPLQEKIEGAGTVLLVEDNTQVGEVSKMLLESLGYRVLRAECPATAIEMLTREHDVQVVLSDIVMPGDMDGLSFARELRSLYPALPVLLATGYSSAAERVGSEFPIIRKPYDNATLGTAVKDVMAQCKQRQVIPA